MRAKSVIIFIIVILTSFVQGCHAQEKKSDVIRMGGVIDTDGTTTDWTISRKLLSAQPAWNPEKEEVPLSASKAAQIVIAEMQKKSPEVKIWFVHHIKLYNFKKTEYPNRWFYCIAVGKDEKDYDSKMEIFLLLDGQIVQPTVDTHRK